MAPESEWTPEVARHYAETYGEHASHPIVVQLAELVPSDVVVDIGCGSGNVVRLVAAQVPDGSVLGVDPSEEMIRIACESVPANARFERAPARAIPLDPDSVSLALAVHSVHHWEDVGEGLDEIRRVLRPDGRVLLAFEERYDSFSDGLIAAMLSDMGFEDIATARHDLGDEEVLQTVMARWP